MAAEDATRTRGLIPLVLVAAVAMRGHWIQRHHRQWSHDVAPLVMVHVHRGQEAKLYHVPAIEHFAIIAELGQHDDVKFS